jgi:Ca2+:H+ antiporter
VGLVLVATLLFTIVAAADWEGDIREHTLEVLTVPISIVLLLVYIGVTAWQLRRHRLLYVSAEEEDVSAWPLRRTLLVLAIATAATAFVAEILVGSIETFAESLHLSDFFVAAVIVAIVGNAAEHGGAVIVSRRGQVELATEIAVSSSAQVAVFLIPAVAVISWAISPLSFAFREVEIAVLAGASILAAAVLARGRSSSRRGWVLIAGYIVAAAVFYKAGGR